MEAQFIANNNVMTRIVVQLNIDETRRISEILQ